MGNRMRGKSGSMDEKAIFIFGICLWFVHSTHAHTRTHAYIHSNQWYFGQLCNCVLSIGTFYWHKPAHIRAYIDKCTQRKLNLKQIHTHTHTRAVWWYAIYLIAFYVFLLLCLCSILFYFCYLNRIFRNDSLFRLLTNKEFARFDTLFPLECMCTIVCVCVCVFYQYFEKRWRHLLKMNTNQMCKYLMNWKFMQSKISIPFSHSRNSHSFTHSHIYTHTHA